MIGDKHHGGHHGHDGLLKWVNLLSILAIFGLEIYTYSQFGSFVSWWSALLSNSWLILNLIFHVLPHHQLISFLKCRVCLVYIWFGLQLFVDIIAIILVSISGAIDGVVPTGVENSEIDTYIIVASFIIVLSIVQGISWVCLTSRLAREHHEELFHHNEFKHHH